MENHEPDSLNPKPIISTLAVVAGVLLVAFITVYALFDVSKASLAAPERVRPPVDNFDALQQARRRQLTLYGWVDRQNNIAHIPIEEAMNIVVEQYAEDSQP